MQTEFGAEPVVFVEIEQDFCAHTYGVAPCTAVLGAAVGRKCYNTRRTCQDAENYSPGPLTLRFARDQEGFAPYGYVIPSLISVSTAPTVLNVASVDQDSGPLGKRATVEAVFRDHLHSDLLVDKYRLERRTGAAQVDEPGYDPYERGSFWSKWLARNPFHAGRIMRVREGYLGQPLGDMRTRTYLIDSVDGPDSSGTVRVRGKDVLMLADNRRAQAPRPSVGELASGIDAAATSLIVANTIAGDYPDGVRTVRIGDELMTYTGTSFNAGLGQTTLTGLTRGTDGTAAADHEAEATVQLCQRYVNTPAWAVARDLLIAFGNVPESYISSAAWEAEWTAYLPQFSVSAVLSEPTGVVELVGELAQQCLFYLWWDERAAQIRFRALRAPETAPVHLDDAGHLLADSIGVRARVEQRVSQVWVYYQRRNQVEALDRVGNFARRRIHADLGAESSAEYGEARIMTIFSRWLTTDAQVISLASRILNRFRDAPRHVSVRVDAKDGAIWTGDVVDLTHHRLVGDAGRPLRSRFQVIAAEEAKPGEEVALDLLTFELVGRFARWMADASPSWDAATEEQREDGMWWAGPGGAMADGSKGYQWQ